MASSRRSRSTNPASSPSKSTVNEDKVFLIYNGGQAFEHSRRKLSKISKFFSALFEGDYCDSKKREISIMHSEDETIFEEFLNCAKCEQPFEVVEFSVNDALKKYENNNLKELLKLLNLAFYLIADDMVNCILHILVTCWFNPDYVLKIWRKSKKIGYCDLENAAFAMILDIFQTIPRNLLLNLSKPNIEEIIKNPCLRCPEQDFEDIVNDWARKNDRTLKVWRNTIVSEFKKSRIHRKDRYLQYISGFTIPETGEKTIIYSWNGTELNELSYITDAIKPFSLMGSQILGRGFSIYIVGGKSPIGENNFNTNVVRYCGITKKCYKVASLSIPRRDMAAVFIGNKLVLVGGVGMKSEKLRSVQVLDIHTGVLMDGKIVPDHLEENPPVCVFEKKLLVAKINIYSYNMEKNIWQMFWENTSKISISNITCYKGKVYLTTNVSEKQNVMIYILETLESSRRHGNKYPVALYVFSISVEAPYNCLTIEDSLIWFSMLNPTMLKIQGGQCKSHLKYKKLFEKSVKINNNIRLKHRVGCFHILKLQALHPETQEAH